MQCCPTYEPPCVGSVWQPPMWQNESPYTPYPQTDDTHVPTVSHEPISAGFSLRDNEIPRTEGINAVKVLDIMRTAIGEAGYVASTTEQRIAGDVVTAASIPYRSGDVEYTHRLRAVIDSSSNRVSFTVFTYASDPDGGYAEFVVPQSVVNAVAEKIKASLMKVGKWKDSTDASST